MEQHRLHWSLPPCGSKAFLSEEGDDVLRHGSAHRSFTASGESRVQKRADLEIRLEFIKAKLNTENPNNL